MQECVSHHLILSWGLLQLDPELEPRSSSGSVLLAGLILLGIVCVGPCGWRMVCENLGKDLFLEPQFPS